MISIFTSPYYAEINHIYDLLQNNGIKASITPKECNIGQTAVLDSQAWPSIWVYSVNDEVRARRVVQRYEFNEIKENIEKRKRIYVTSADQHSLRLTTSIFGFFKGLDQDKRIPSKPVISDSIKTEIPNQQAVNVAPTAIPKSSLKSLTKDFFALCRSLIPLCQAPATDQNTINSPSRTQLLMYRDNQRIAWYRKQSYREFDQLQFDNKHKTVN